MIAMGVLDAFENREFVARSEVHFELPDAIDEVIVDTLAVPDIAPLAFPA